MPSYRTLPTARDVFVGRDRSIGGFVTIPGRGDVRVVSGRVIETAVGAANKRLRTAIANTSDRKK